VPYRFARSEVEVRLTPRAVEIFLKGERADSDDFGQSFRAEVGHRFRLMPAGHSD
jgi:hypothetical protein